MAPGLCVLIEKRIHGRAHSTLNMFLNTVLQMNHLWTKRAKKQGIF